MGTIRQHNKKILLLSDKQIQKETEMDYFNSFESHMDYEGQSKAEFVSRTIVVLFGVVGFVFGWYIEQFSQTVYILGAGLVFAAIVSTHIIIIGTVNIIVLYHVW